MWASAAVTRQDIVRLREGCAPCDSDTLRLDDLTLCEGPGSGPWEEATAILRDAQYEVADFVAVRNRESVA